MFIVPLKLTENKSIASEFMDVHNEWIKQGFEDGVFLLSGSLHPDLGGSVIAHNTSISDLQKRVNTDLFVAENIVSTEILDVDTKKVDDRLSFLVS